MRRTWLVLGVCAAFGTNGCASWRTPVPLTDDAAAPPTPPPAVVVVRPSTATEPSPPAIVQTAYTSNPQASRNVPPQDALTLAAESLERGDKETAANHLESYIRRHPDEVMFRLQLVELLIQTKADARAKVHLEQFVARSKAAPEPVRKFLVHAHTRLMEIAQRSDDSFGELLHRGVGLLLLVEEQDANPHRDEEFCEEMLCKSLRALTEAKELKPGDPRVRVYLTEVYTRMGNRRAATQERSAARETLAPGELTPAERERVILP